MAATYTVKQVADILGYSTNSIYTFLKEKRIRGIRVGKGRFRVPQGELDRLLMGLQIGQKSVHTARPDEMHMQTPDMITHNAIISSQSSATVSRAGSDIRPYSMEPVGYHHIEIPNYFIWYFGMVSIILGASLSIFGKTFEILGSGIVMVLRPVMQVTLIAGGMGLLLTDIGGLVKTLWHGLFYFLLIGAYIILVILLLSMGDINGAIFFGGLAVCALLGRLMRVGGVGQVTMYIFWITAIAGPISLVYDPHNIHISLWIHHFAFLGMNSHLIIAGTSLLGAIGLGISYQRGFRKIYNILIVFIGLMLYVFGYWFASENYWNRSLLLLFTGFFCFFTPVWMRHTFNHQRVRGIVFSMFGIVFALHMTVIGLIYIFQLNMYDYASREIQKKLLYANILIEYSLQQNKLAIEGVAAIPSVAKAIAKNDTESLALISRGFFDGNKSLRRLYFVNANADIVYHYPLTNKLRISNAAIREYFSVPMTTKKTFISDLYEIQTDITLNVITISAPVSNGNGTLAGVVVGSIDLGRLGSRLQEIVSNEIGEYVTVLDPHGRQIIHPETGVIGKNITEHDVLSKSLRGEQGISDYVLSSGDLALAGYGSVGTQGWGLAIIKPMRGVFATTRAASVVIVTLLCISVFCIGIYRLIHTLIKIDKVYDEAKDSRKALIVPDKKGGKNRRIQDLHDPPSG